MGSARLGCGVSRLFCVGAFDLIKGQKVVAIIRIICYNTNEIACFYSNLVLQHSERGNVF